MNQEKPVLGVLGGSGLYGFPGLEPLERRHVETPFGPPSGPVVLGRWNGRTVAFLARHGEGHTLDPSEVNYRANIYALKAVGVERLIGVSACGSLRDSIGPGDIVVPDQIFDATRGRARSFFGEGVVAHLSAPDPFCPVLSSLLAESAETAGSRVHRGGTYLTIEGPRFSTRAESQVYRGWGMSIIGMTTSPEAFLAREAELCYAVLAHVTDYDVWHMSEEAVTVEMVVARLQQNAERAGSVIGNCWGGCRATVAAVTRCATPCSLGPRRSCRTPARG
jgi:5'-methylthioadenosine phosphorylase